MTDESPPVWEVDVLVVGSGAGALTAALTAAELGLAPLVVEKGHLWGGTSASSGGTLWIPCSRHMREAGLEDTPEEAFEYVKALVGDETPDSKIKAYIDNAAKMLDFLERHGGPKFRCVNYADYHMDLPGAKQNRSHETVPITAGQLGPDYASLQPCIRPAKPSDGSTGPLARRVPSSPAARAGCGPSSRSWAAIGWTCRNATARRRIAASPPATPCWRSCA